MKCLISKMFWENGEPIIKSICTPYFSHSNKVLWQTSIIPLCLGIVGYKFLEDLRIKAVTLK